MFCTIEQKVKYGCSNRTISCPYNKAKDCCEYPKRVKVFIFFIPFSSTTPSLALFSVPLILSCLVTDTHKLELALVWLGS